MRKLLKTFILILVICATAICFIRFNKNSGSSIIENIDTVNSPRYKVGVIQGAASMYSGEKNFPKSQIKYMNEAVDGYMALESGRIDVLMQDSRTAEFAANNNHNIAIFPKEYDTIQIVTAVKKGNMQLLNQVNEYIDEYVTSGLCEVSMRYWLSDLPNKKMPDLPDVKNPNGVLRVGTNAMIEPYSYLGPNGKLQGSDIEFAKRLGIHLNKEVNFSILNFSELITALESNKIDIVIANLNATEERAKAVSFSKPYLTTKIVPMVKSSRLAQKAIYQNLDELQDKQFGIITGSIFDDVLHSTFPNAKSVYFNSVPDILLSLEQGKIDAALFDLPMAKTIEKNTGKIKVLYPIMQKGDYASILSKENVQLNNKISAIISNMKQDGTLKEIDDIWFGNDESKKVLPETLGDNKKGILKVAVNATYPPFTFIKNNRIVGYDIDLADRIGKRLGYGIEIYNMDFPAIIPSVISGKTDIGMGGISITEERKESVLFTESTYDGGIVAVVNATELEEQNTSFLSGVRKSMYRTFKEEDRYKLILDGLGLTVIIAALSVIIGTILGFLVCICRRSNKKIFNVPAKIYITIVQGIPILVLLMVLYYIIFADLQADPILIASLAFGLDFAAYASEMFRSGIDAVDKGQIEAASAMGFNKYQTFMKITLPQALKHILPVYRGEVISTIKITSIVGYIAIQDLTKMSDIIRSRTYEAFFPLIATAIIYFVMAYIMAEVIKLFEFKVNPLHRKRVIKGIKKISE